MPEIQAADQHPVGQNVALEGLGDDPVTQRQKRVELLMLGRLSYICPEIKIGSGAYQEYLI